MVAHRDHPLPLPWNGRWSRNLRSTNPSTVPLQSVIAHSLGAPRGGAHEIHQSNQTSALSAPPTMARHAGRRAAKAGCGADRRGAGGRLPWWSTGARTVRGVGRAVGRAGMERDGTDAVDFTAVAWLITGSGEARLRCGSSSGTTSPSLTGLLPTPWVRLRSRKVPYLAHILRFRRYLLPPNASRTGCNGMC